MESSLIDRTTVLRSKNAGPFLITLDVVFGDHDDMDLVRRKLTPELIADAYKTSANAVIGPDFVSELNAMKISIRRRRPCGHPGDGDCYGMSQEQPLARLLHQLGS